MIRGKRLRPLATVSDKPLELEGYGTIPPLTETLPGFKAPTNYFGIFIPKGVPDDVIATVDKIWKDTIANSDAREEIRDVARRAVCAVVGRCRAKGGIPGRAGQCLAAVRRRQGQGFARHRRHSETLTPPCRSPEQATPASSARRGGCSRPLAQRFPVRARLDGLGIAILIGSIMMDRLRSRTSTRTRSPDCCRDCSASP